MQIADEIAREIKKNDSESVDSLKLRTGNLLGTITPTMKVKLDVFAYELPFLKIRSVGSLKVGDRVLVSIVNKGKDHVVVGVI